MKILHVVPAYHPEGPGGIEVYARSLVRTQRERGHQVVVLAGCAAPWARVGYERDQVDGTTVLRLHRDDLYFDHYAKAWHPGVEQQFGEILAAERPEILHVHHWLRLTCNLVEVAGRHGVPAVATLHDVSSSCPRGFRVRRDGSACFRELCVASCHDCVPRWGCETEAETAEGILLFRQAMLHELSAARTVLVSSALTGDLVSRTTGLDRARIRELTLGYERRSQVALDRPPLPGPCEPFRFAHWGNLAPHKGTATLLQAVHLLAREGQVARPFELHVLGDTEPLRAGLPRDQAVPVVWHGGFTFDDLVRLRPHMAVFPSHCFETFSFALEESFELGIPSIVSDLGVMPHRAGRAAVSVPPQRPEALAAAMRAVLQDPGLCDRLAAHIPPLSPTPAQHAEALDRAYQLALGSPAQPASPPVPLHRWLSFLVQQRDSAQALICPAGGPR